MARLWRIACSSFRQKAFFASFCASSLALSYLSPSSFFYCCPLLVIPFLFFFVFAFSNFIFPTPTSMIDVQMPGMCKFVSRNFFKFFFSDLGQVPWSSKFQWVATCHLPGLGLWTSTLNLGSCQVGTPRLGSRESGLSRGPPTPGSPHLSHLISPRIWIHKYRYPGVCNFV